MGGCGEFLEADCRDATRQQREEGETLGWEEQGGRWKGERREGLVSRRKGCQTTAWQETASMAPTELASWAALVRSSRPLSFFSEPLR